MKQLLYNRTTADEPCIHMQHQLAHIIRIRKKLHTLDYVILAFLFLALGAFFFLRITRRTEWITVSVKIQPADLWWKASPEPWYASSLALKQEAFNTFGEKIAEIKDIHVFETTEGRSDVVAELSLKTSYDARRHQHVYNYQPVLIGNPIEVTFNAFVLRGVITSINNAYTYVDKTIEIRLLAEFPWIVNALTQGLQAKDALGRVVAEIQKIDVQNAQTYEFTEGNGRRFVILGEDPFRKDVTIRLKIKAIEYNRAYYSVYGSPLTIGAVFKIQFPSVSINYSNISAVN